MDDLGLPPGWAHHSNIRRDFADREAAPDRLLTAEEWRAGMAVSGDLFLRLVAAVLSKDERVSSARVVRDGLEHVVEVVTVDGRRNDLRRTQWVSDARGMPVRGASDREDVVR